MNKVLSVTLLALMLASCSSDLQEARVGPTPPASVHPIACVDRVLTKPFIVDQQLRYDPPGSLAASLDWRRVCDLAVRPGSAAAASLVLEGFTTETVTFAVATAARGSLQHHPVYWVVLSGKNACVTSVNSLRCLPNQHAVGQDYDASPGPNLGKWIDGYTRPGLDAYVGSVAS